MAKCVVDYSGRLTAHLPEASRLIMVKGDGSVLVHADVGSKALNWMAPPCRLRIEEPGVAEPGTAEAGADESGERESGEEEPGDSESGEREPGEFEQRWTITNKAGETLIIEILEIHSDHEFPLGEEPGLEKDGVEDHLQRLLAERLGVLGKGWSLVRREFPTPIGPVDLMCRDPEGQAVAVEIKRRGEIDGVEQLTRYLDLLNRDPLLAPVAGVFAAQEIKPQARTLAEDRGIRCVVLDYEEMRGLPSDSLRLF